MVLYFSLPDNIVKYFVVQNEEGEKEKKRKIKKKKTNDTGILLASAAECQKGIHPK